MGRCCDANRTGAPQDLPNSRVRRGHTPASSFRAWEAVTGGGEVEGPVVCPPRRSEGAGLSCALQPLWASTRSLGRAGDAVPAQSSRELRSGERRDTGDLQTRPEPPSLEPACRQALAAQQVPERRDSFHPSAASPSPLVPESCDFPRRQETLPLLRSVFCRRGGVQDGERGE